MITKHCYILLLLFFFGCRDNDDRDAPAPYGPLPTAAQLNWHEMEMYCLIHFTPTTYENKEWGYGDASPEIFNPPNFDADQIASAAKAGGFKGLIVVAKHHDGFCLWPTKTTEYNISKSPWREGKGDMVKEFEEATRRQGMQFGVYVSAWDRNHPDYGNSKYTDAYREQLRELYSNYGELFMSWHDGANGGSGYYGGARETRRIDHGTYYEWEEKTWPITYELQPTAVIFSDVGPGTRWGGNERGMAGETCWATFTPVGPNGSKAAPGHLDSLSVATLGTGHRNGKYWIPAECDVPQRAGWFYHPEQDDKVKSPERLFEIYLRSVGRGAAFNLGLAPTPEGVLHPNDVASLEGFGKKLTETFTTNYARGAKVTATNVRNGRERAYGPANLLDDDRYSYWATDDSVTTPELEIELKEAYTFDLIRLRENIKLGQRIDSVWIDVWSDDSWQPLARATSIGSSRIVKLESPVSTNRLRLRVFAPVAPALSDLGIFKESTSGFSSAEAGRKALDRSKWRVVDTNLKGGSPHMAHDGAPETSWITDESSFPGYFVIDFQEAHDLTAFSYLPRQDGNKKGMIGDYALEVSMDGDNWSQVLQGEFANIINNPILQYIEFQHRVKARLLRFTVTGPADKSSDRSQIAIAEFNVFSE